MFFNKDKVAKSINLYAKGVESNLNPLKIL